MGPGSAYVIATIIVLMIPVWITGGLMFADKIKTENGWTLVCFGLTAITIGAALIAAALAVVVLAVWGLGSLLTFWGVP